MRRSFKGLSPEEEEERLEKELEAGREQVEKLYYQEAAPMPKKIIIGDLFEIARLQVRFSRCCLNDLRFFREIGSGEDRLDRAEEEIQFLCKERNLLRDIEKREDCLCRTEERIQLLRTECDALLGKARKELEQLKEEIGQAKLGVPRG